MIDPISVLFSLIKWLIAFLVKLITGKSYEYLSNEDNWYIKYSLIVVIVIVLILCLILILINSFKGISHILNEFFGLDAYKYINVLDIDLEDNFNKLYLPEFIISCIGLASIIGILLYIISEEKANNKTEETEKTEETASWFSKQFNNLRNKKPTPTTTQQEIPDILNDISNDITTKQQDPSILKNTVSTLDQ